MVICDLRGNILLNEYQAERFYVQGNDWLDVAIAANISKATGVPMSELLVQVRAGILWDTMVTRLGIDPKVAYNVTAYPFAHTSIYSEKLQKYNMAKIQKYQVCDPQQPCWSSMPMPYMASRFRW